MTMQECLEQVGYKFREEMNGTRWGILQPTGKFLHHTDTLDDAIQSVVREIEQIRGILTEERALLVFSREGTAYWENIVKSYDDAMDSVQPHD